MNIFRNCYTPEKIKFILMIGMILWVSSNLLHAQISDFEAKKVFESSISIQKSGMIILGSWAGLNILSGIGGTVRFENERKYFHQMNAAWNVVNLGIAAFGFYGAINADLTLGTNEILNEMKNFDRILLINSALDLAYIGTGAYLWNKSLSNNSNRLNGYGKSIVLQGGFLLLFDAILYLIHHQQTQKFANSGIELSLNATGFQIAF